MLDWLVIWGVAQGAGLIFKPILEDLAKDAAKDWAKDILKGIPGKVFEKLKKDDIDIAAGKALKEFLQLMQQQLKVRCKLPEGEIKEYTGDIKKFISDKSVKETLGKAFDISCEDLNSRILEDSWQKVQLKALPAKFNWELLTEQYFIQVQELLEKSKELHSILELQKLSNIETNTKEIAGIVADFNLVKYQEAIRECYGNLKLDSLDTTGYAYNELKLWRMFIAQNVREVHQVLPQVHELPKEHLKRLRESDQVETEIAAEELENHKRVYLEQPIRSVLDVVNDKQTYKYIVVLGDPGSGKSTLLQYLALNWANSPLDNVISLPIPLLIELRTYMRRRDDKECHNFLEFFHKCSGVMTHLNQHQLHEQLKAGNALVMFDGLDEVFDPGKREDVITDIHRFTNDYPNVQVIVTSRVIGYKPQRLRDAEFRHFMLQDLDSEQIQDFIHRWHELTFSDEADKVRKRERLHRGIEASKAITELAGNPLLLTMMAILNRNQELPRDRAELYNQASRVLLHQWDVERALVEDERLDHKTIDYKDKQAMLRQVAYSMQTSDKGLAGNLIRDSQLENILAAYLRTLEINQPRQAARVMINQLRTRNFMLCFLGADYYAFVHRTFLEYFCAWEFVWQFKETQTLSIEVLKQDVFGKHWQDETWHEVLLLIAGMIEPKFVGEIIDYLISLNGEEEKFINLFLAAKCLAEVRNRSVIMPKADELLTLLQNLTRYEPCDDGLSQDDKEIQLVEEIRTQAVATIATTWQDSVDTKTFLQKIATVDEHPYVRWIAIEKLAQIYKDNANTKLFLKERATVDVNSNVRQTAVEQLVQAYKDDSDIKTFLRELAIFDKDSDVRCTAMQQLVQAYKDDHNTKTFLQERATTDKNLFMRQTAVEQLARTYKDDSNTKTLLMEIATMNDDWSMREIAVQQLAQAYKQNSDIKIFLRERATADESSVVRRTAVFQLAHAYKDDSETKIFLQERATADNSSVVRRTAVEQLAHAYQEDSDTKTLLLERATVDNSPRVREKAVEQLAQNYKDDLDTKTFLRERATADNNSDVRWIAVEELAQNYKDDPDTKTFLRERATVDNNSDVRGPLVEIVAHAYKDDSGTKIFLRERAIADADSYVRQTAVEQLAYAYRDDSDTKTFLQERATADDDWSVRRTAMQELALAYKSQSELFDFYHNFSINDPFKGSHDDIIPNPRRVALEIIVKQYPQHSQTLPLLRDRAENDPDEEVREYAEKQLKRWQG
ncbi:HEAT repeat domain-containing protein [Nostoc sp. PCC 7107]|uniref:HEAT repeat domain-containing protein n=1 Tax=Nostoc sp. PCC 7107 TaxID=317936 RepID=UPI00029EEB9B|nr:HEAT repeat domain-containing protein [Nostoc sp. PCC 7107]AFY43902.1 putative signal transduction protein with Nacht domain [Nostoc sp. PCC 7107]